MPDSDTFPTSPLNPDESTPGNPAVAESSLLFTALPFPNSISVPIHYTPDSLSVTQLPIAIVGDVELTEVGQITPPDDPWLDWTLWRHVTTPVAAEDRQMKNQDINELRASRECVGVGRVDGRDGYREKNRVAAAKCRAKKKAHMDSLEDDHRTQRMLNTLLKQTEKDLRDELSVLRTQALDHGCCSCQAIQAYNDRRARSLAANKNFGGVDDIRRDSMVGSLSVVPAPPSIAQSLCDPDISHSSWEPSTRRSLSV